MLTHKLTTRIGKLLKTIMRLRGGGSALPGLVVERLDPDFIVRALSHVPRGVVVISGTNGKTTTTKMVVQLLRSLDLHVFTNPSGSNFTRGIVSSLLDHVDADGRLDADIAVIELDEAHAVHFVRQIQPRYALILNVLRDQLDRFGEIDTTTQMLRKVVDQTTEGVVLNYEDELVRGLSNGQPGDKVRYFGLSDTLRKQFPNDRDLHGSKTKRPAHTAGETRDVTLVSIGDKGAVFTIDGHEQPPVQLTLDGMYNTFNAAAALTLARLIVPDNDKQLLDELKTVRPAFGRGEAVSIDGEPLEIILVKNPSGFRLALQSYPSSGVATMIAINDNYADGRDMSWLWDVDFDSLAPSVSMVSGARAYDMALRLQYDQIDVTNVTDDLREGLKQFISSTSGPRRIFCTYSAMLSLRRELSKTYDVEGIEA